MGDTDKTLKETVEELPWLKIAYTVVEFGLLFGELANHYFVKKRYI